MNPRRVHELMRQHFPEVNVASRDWVVVADEYGLRRGVLEGLIDKYISGADLLVEAARKVGDFLPVAAALDFVAQHVGQGDIRLPPICESRSRWLLRLKAVSQPERFYLPLVEVARVAASLHCCRNACHCSNAFRFSGT